MEYVNQTTVYKEFVREERLSIIDQIVRHQVEKIIRSMSKEDLLSICSVKMWDNPYEGELKVRVSMKTPDTTTIRNVTYEKGWKKEIQDIANANDLGPEDLEELIKFVQTRRLE